MGFFAKLKQLAGIGGVKLQLLPAVTTYTRGGGTLTGNLAVTSKTDQKITSIIIRVQEIVTTKEG